MCCLLLIQWYAISGFDDRRCIYEKQAMPPWQPCFFWADKISFTILVGGHLVAIFSKLLSISDHSFQRFLSLAYRIIRGAGQAP